MPLSHVHALEPLDNHIKSHKGVQGREPNDFSCAEFRGSVWPNQGDSSAHVLVERDGRIEHRGRFDFGAKATALASQCLSVRP